MENPIGTLFSKRWGWLTIWGICLLTSLLFFLIMALALAHPWSDTSADRIAWYHQEECESVDTSGFFLQIMNFWSNFAYLAAGLLIVWFTSSPIGRAVGIVLITLAVGSGWFHGTLTEFGQTLDLIGVYCALTAMIAFAIIELIPLDHDGVAAWLLFAGAMILGAVGGFLRTKVRFFDSDYFTPFLVFLLVVYMVVLYWRHAKGKEQDLLWPAIFTGVSGLLALIFKFTDGDKNLLASHGGNYAMCTYDPGSPLQGHALWHLLSAVMFACVYEYIRSVLERTESVFPWRTTA